MNTIATSAAQTSERISAFKELETNEWFAGKSIARNWITI